MGADLPSRQTLRVEEQDDLVDPVQAALSFLDDLRLERAAQIPGHVDLHIAGALREYRLGPGPVTYVARPDPGRVTAVVV